MSDRPVVQAGRAAKASSTFTCRGQWEPQLGLSGWTMQSVMPTEPVAGP